MTRARTSALLVLMAISAIGCATTTTRNERFSPAHLMQAAQDGPWAMSNFFPTPESLPPINMFEGRLQLEPDRSKAHVRVLRDRYGRGGRIGAAADVLPEFDFEFVQTADALVPVVRGAIPNRHSAFELILEPGRVWNEPADGDFTRAAIPFSLEERNENCLHNGVLTFLFRNDGTVSNAAFEIGSETCSYFQFDAWGYVPARYVRGPVASNEDVISRYRDEVLHRLPTRPIEELGSRYRGVDSSRFGLSAEVAPEDMTLYGVVADGIHYVSRCETRFGAYPFCDVLDLPSYSLAKSLAAGLATMRLAQSHPEISSARVTQYVPQCDAKSWDGVTLGNALDMTTGHFNSSASLADEYAADLAPFFAAEDHSSKIRFACAHYPRKAPAGSVWVYHTTDSYLLGSALAAFYRSVHGEKADLVQDVLVTPIWSPLHLSPTAAVVRRTYDSDRQPFMAYGLTLHRDDIAKLATFLTVEHGVIDGRQVINSEMLSDALQRGPTRAALPASTSEFAYKNGFWEWNAQSTLGCARPTWIPIMMGYGGIVVALYPNDVTYYYFSDGDSFRWQAATVEADQIRPICSGKR